jgi:ubiquinone biosynthesis protein
VKLGPLLSTRPDLLPADFQAELAKLQDNAIRVASEVIEEPVSSELGVPTSELFARFDPEPLAAASIGQVGDGLL